MTGHWEWIIVFLVILLIFGGKKIPEIARGLGKGIKEFKRAKDDIRDSIEKAADEKEEEKPQKSSSESTPPAHEDTETTNGK